MNNKLFFFFSILLGLVMFSSFDHNPPVKVLKESTITQKDSAKTIFKVNDSITIENNKTYIIYKKGAHASYYHDKFTGRKTASGQIFDNKKMTAAHKKLPFGSKVRVTNEANGKSVIVTVNDRGPFAKGRDIDLSRKAFMEITSHSGHGAMKVTLELVSEK
jgi:rare lipoprotein A